MTDETDFRRADNLAGVLVSMTGLFGSIAEIINREPGPLRAYAAPLDQIVISLVMMGAADPEGSPSGDDGDETVQGHAAEAPASDEEHDDD